LNDQQLLEEYKKECMMIRHGVDTDIQKCFEEGKAIIIEGHNLDPAAFIELLETRSLQDNPMDITDEVLSLPPHPDNIKNGEQGGAKEKKKKQMFSKGIIVPFVLSMNERDHKLLLENWLSCSARDQGHVRNLGGDAEAQAAALLHRLQLVQDYLCSCVPPFVRVDVNAHAFMETLSVLHSAVLERIQQWYASDEFVPNSESKCP